MGKASKKDDPTSDLRQRKSTTKKEDENDDDNIPEDMKEFIQKKQAATGKKYIYRGPKKPEESIQHMLIHGAPESRDKPVTFWGMLLYPLILAVLFFVSLLIFHYAPHDKSKFGPGRFRLPPRGSGRMQQQQRPPPSVVDP